MNNPIRVCGQWWPGLVSDSMREMVSVGSLERVELAVKIFHHVGQLQRHPLNPALSHSYPSLQWWFLAGSLHIHPVYISLQDGLPFVLHLWTHTRSLRCFPPSSLDTLSLPSSYPTELTALAAGSHFTVPSLCFIPSPSTPLSEIPLPHLLPSYWLPDIYYSQSVVRQPLIHSRLL